jgi:hypothetical protein
MGRGAGKLPVLLVNRSSRLGRARIESISGDHPIAVRAVVSHIVREERVASQSRSWVLGLLKATSSSYDQTM